jgi:hypothetical protein
LYLKGITLAHFENSLIEPDLYHPLAWSDDYNKFILELKNYFGSPDAVGEAESKLKNLSMKPTSTLPNTLSLINMQLLLVGITAHSDTNSIVDFQPTLRMKCHMSVNPPHSPNSELWANLLMAVTGNAKKTLIENVVDSRRRKTLKRHTINLIPLHQPRTIRTNHRRNKSLNMNLAHLLITLIRKSRNWGTSSEKTVNSLPPNELVNLPTISASSVEVLDTPPENVQNALPLLQRPRATQQRENPTSLKALQLRTQKNRKQSFRLHTD